jgi:hypothetical protein
MRMQQSPGLGVALRGFGENVLCMYAALMACVGIRSGAWQWDLTSCKVKCCECHEVIEDIMDRSLLGALSVAVQAQNTTFQYK